MTSYFGDARCFVSLLGLEWRSLSTKTAIIGPCTPSPPTVWVALDPSTQENGCLRVLPKSHKRQYEHFQDDRDGLVLNQACKEGQYDEHDVVDIELEPGQMSLHDVGLVHGSSPNISTIRRAGVAFRYMPSTSHFRRDAIQAGEGSGYLVDFSTRPLWLVSGVDQCGLNDFQVGH